MWYYRRNKQKAYALYEVSFVISWEYEMLLHSYTYTTTDCYLFLDTTVKYNFPRNFNFINFQI